MTKDSKFIFIKNKDVADRLESNGFIIVEKNKDSWIFLNDPQLSLPDNINKKNLIYTNILYF